MNKPCCGVVTGSLFLKYFCLNLVFLLCLQENYAYFLFFFVYILVVSWGFINVLLGLLFSFLTEHRDRSERLSAIDFRTNMDQAFAAVDKNHDGLISLEMTRLIMKEMAVSFLEADRAVSISSLTTGLQLIVKAILQVTPVATSNVPVDTMNALRVEVQDTSLNSVDMISIDRSNTCADSGRESASKKSMMDRVSEAIADTIMIHESVLSDAEIDILLNKLYSVGEGGSIKSQGVNIAMFYEFPAKCLSRSAKEYIRNARKELSLLQQTSGNINFEKSERSKGCRKLSVFNYLDSELCDAFSDVVISTLCIIFVATTDKRIMSYLIITACLLESGGRYVAKGHLRF